MVCEIRLDRYFKEQTEVTSELLAVWHYLSGNKLTTSAKGVNSIQNPRLKDIALTATANRLKRGYSAAREKLEEV